MEKSKACKSEFEDYKINPETVFSQNLSEEFFIEAAPDVIIFLLQKQVCHTLHSNRDRLFPFHFIR